MKKILSIFAALAVASALSATRAVTTTAVRSWIACRPSASWQDNVCPPHTNIAPYNNLQSTDKQLIFNPELMHQADNDWYSRFMAFFKAHTNSTGTDLLMAGNQQPAASKVLRDGQLYIIHNNVKFNANGTMVK